MDVPVESLTYLKVGDLAKRTGKTVRAIHLYEELGLLQPVRSKGGFRLYPQRAAARVEWIQKLQDMGFSLTEIKAFLQVWEASATGPDAMSTVREIFADKLREARQTITRLTTLVTELEDSLSYLDSCRSCTPAHTTSACDCCDINGHEGQAPTLVDGLTTRQTA